MANSHNQSFFGQKSGLIVQSSSKEEPYIFFQCIKEKNNGNWEKPSRGEGKKIKFNLKEIVWILQVLKHNTNKWAPFLELYKDKLELMFLLPYFPDLNPMDWFWKFMPK